MLNINHFQPDEAAIHAATAPVAFATAPAVRAPQMVGVIFVRPLREPTYPTKREVGTMIPLKGVLGWDGIYLSSKKGATCAKSNGLLR